MSFEVYKIICDETSSDPKLCYYGATEMGLAHRFNQHQTAAKQYERYKALGQKRNMQAYSFRSREILAKTNPRIESIRKGLTKQEAFIYESFLIEQHPCCNAAVSRMYGGSRVQQYQRDKKYRPELYQKRLDKFTEYRKKNHDLIREKLSRKIECEHGCGSTFQYRNKGQHMKSCKALKNKEQ